MRKLLTLVVIILNLIAFAGSALSADQGTNKTGSLVIIGGALRNDNADVYTRIVDLAGGKGAKIAIIPTASGNPIKNGQRQADVFKEYGVEPFVVPIGAVKKMNNYETEAYNEELVQQIRGCTAVYFIGGDQERIIKALYDKEGKRTPVLQAVWDVYNKGGVIAGSSAGAAIMSEVMFRDGEVLDVLKYGVREGKEIDRGLGFIGSGVFVDQHFFAKGRFARTLVAMQQKGIKLGIGVDENTAIVVTNKDDVEVVGYMGALVVDLSRATRNPAIKEFNIKNARLTYLEKGDSFNLSTKDVLVNPIKDQLDPKDPYFEGKIAYNDILANTVLVDLLYNLIDNAEPEAKGLAFTLRADKEDLARGFEFTFKKSVDSAGYYTGAYGRDNYTIKNIYLDVKPVTINNPVYR